MIISFSTSVCSILFRIVLAASSTFDISSTSSVIAILSINANRCGLFPYSSIDLFIGSVICSLFFCKISSIGTSLMIALSTSRFQSIRSLLSCSICSAFGVFLPTFLVARYGPLQSNTVRLHHYHDTVLKVHYKQYFIHFPYPLLI